MGKLRLQVQLSIDGYIAGTNGEMDWMIWNWDDKVKDYVGELTKPVDRIVLGRKLAEGFIPHWQKAAEADANDWAAHKFTDTPKVVFSNTLRSMEGKNTSVSNADIAIEIPRLVDEVSGDTIAYGGGAFVSSLIEENLIDEYLLFINPVILGGGLPIFDKLSAKLPLTPVETISFECGITVLHYKKI